MIASLPMYARTSNRWAHDALWALIRENLRDQGVAAPDGLDHDIDHMDSWGRDDLVLGQICNLPLRQIFMDDVTMIGAADYELAGCPAGHYRSHFVVRRDCSAQAPSEMFDTRFVYNEPLSQSGYGAAQIWAEEHGSQFSLAAQTGSHRASIAAIANGTGDIAAIDAQTWRIECGENPDTDALKIIGHTAPSPGMTFITGKGQNPKPYFTAIQTAISQLQPQAARVLGLTSIVALLHDDYVLPFPSEPLKYLHCDGLAATESLQTGVK